MSKRQQQLTEAWLTIACSVITPWVGWSTGTVSVEAAAILSLQAGLLTAKAAFSEKPGEKAPKKTKEPKP